MELIDVILSKGNLNRAYKKVVANKGASGVDGVTVEELGDYIRKNKDAIVTSIRNRTYMPKPVRRVYIPKDNGKQRPLGIPTALDRTIQQAIAQPISDIYEEIFSEYSYGFRPGKSCHDAIRQALCYLNSGYEWVVDIDIEQFFDRVNHDKLIQILREQVNDSTTLNLIRKYLKAGVMEKGLEKATTTGVPQGGPLSVVCSNVYLDKLDKELEQRGLRFTIEYKVYRKRGKCILVIELAISIVMHIIDYSIVYTHIMYSFGLIVILLCMSDGYLKRCVKDW